MAENNMEVVAWLTREVVAGKIVATECKPLDVVDELVTLSSAQAEIAVQKQANEALMRERANIIETKREQLARLTARAEAAEKERDALREALERATEWIYDAVHDEHCFTNDPNPDACRCICGKDRLIDDLLELQPLEPKND